METADPDCQVFRHGGTCGKLQLRSGGGASLALREEDGGDLVIAASYRKPGFPPIASADSRIRPDAGVMRHVLSSKQPLVLDDYAAWPERIPRVATGSMGALALAPVFVADCRSLAHDHELTLVYVTQEALTNVRKHAQAEQVRVQVTWLGIDGVRVCVEDDGGCGGRVAERGDPARAIDNERQPAN